MASLLQKAENPIIQPSQQTFFLGLTSEQHSIEENIPSFHKISLTTAPIWQWKSTQPVIPRHHASENNLFIFTSTLIKHWKLTRYCNSVRMQLIPSYEFLRLKKWINIARVKGTKKNFISRKHYLSFNQLQLYFLKCKRILPILY